MKKTRCVLFIKHNIFSANILPYPHPSQSVPSSLSLSLSAYLDGGYLHPNGGYLHKFLDGGYFRTLVIFRHIQMDPPLTMPSLAFPSRCHPLTDISFTFILPSLSPPLLTPHPPRSPYLLTPLLLHPSLLLSPRPLNIPVSEATACIYIYILIFIYLPI